MAWLFLLAVSFLTPLAAQTITVTSPNGAPWCLGSTYTIAWTKTGTMQATVAIRLRAAGSSESEPAALAIANGEANDGSYSWPVPNTLAPGNYFIRVRTDDSTVIGDSPTFAIQACDGAPAVLDLTSPNGGETWKCGETQNIAWSADWSGTVQLNLYQNGAFKGVIASGLPSTSGSHPWKVGATDKGTFAGTGCRVKIVRSYAGGIVPQKALADESQGDFIIRPCIEVSPGLTKPKLVDVRPDLRICKYQPLIVPTDGTTPVKIYVRFLIWNAGGTASPPSHFRYEFKFGGESATVSVPAIEAKKGYMKDIDLVFNGTGPWPYKIEIDPFGEVDESNESNNVKEGKLPGQEPAEVYFCDQD
jgi:hypothetical protein